MGIISKSLLNKWEEEEMAKPQMHTWGEDAYLEQEVCCHNLNNEKIEDMSIHASRIGEWVPMITNDIDAKENQPMPSRTITTDSIRVNTPDMVNNPPHYTQGEIECIDAIEASMSPEEFKGFLKGMVLKYVWRYKMKWDPKQDIQKAMWYLERLERKL